MSKKETNIEKEQTKVVMLYGAAWACFILLCIPTLSFAVVATLLLILLLLSAYLIRRTSEKDSLTYNHTSYIIRGLWFGLFILPAITLGLALIYLLPNYNPSAMKICAQPLAEHILNNPDDTNIPRLYAFIAPCMNGFINDNMKSFLMAGMIAGGPVLLYLLARFGKGTIAALKGALLEKPKSWIL